MEGKSINPFTFVPRLVLQHYEQSPRKLTELHTEEFDGVLMFLDVSGYSTLAEAVGARVGDSHNSVKVATLLNGYFKFLVQIIEKHHGDIAKFAGDALMVFWRVPGPVSKQLPNNNPDLKKLVLLAMKCVTELMEAENFYVDDPNSKKKIELSVHAGLGCGRMTCMHVGGVDDRWEFVIVGDALKQATDVLDLAARKEFVAHPELAWVLDEFRNFKFTAIKTKDKELIEEYKQLASEKPKGYPQLPMRYLGDSNAKSQKEPGASASAAAAIAPDLDSIVAKNREVVKDLVYSYIPIAIWDRLKKNIWIEELRIVSVLFLFLPDLPNDRSLDFKKVQQCVRAAGDHLHGLEGLLRQFIVDDKGCLLIAAFGLPPLSHEDDAYRAVLAALRMRESLTRLNCSSAIGVTTGPAFCGIVGSRGIRNEYAMVGAVVNLSARLMSQARKFDVGVLCDEATYNAALKHSPLEGASALSFNQMPKVSVKGVEELVTIWRPILSIHKSKPKGDIADMTAAAAGSGSTGSARGNNNSVSEGSNPPSSLITSSSTASAPVGGSERSSHAIIGASGSNSGLSSDKGIIGRMNEMAIFDSCLNQILSQDLTGGSLNHKGSLMIIQSEPGLGKSVLMKGFKEKGRSAGAAVFHSACTPVEKTVVYSSWRFIISRMLEEDGAIIFRDDGKTVDVEKTTATVISKYRGLCPSIVQFTALLNPFVSNFQFATTDSVEALKGESRVYKTNELILRLLYSITRKGLGPKKQKLIIIQDDVHNMDSSSTSLLFEVMRNVSSITALKQRPMTTRIYGSEATSDMITGKKQAPLPSRPASAVVHSSTLVQPKNTASGNAGAFVTPSSPATAGTSIGAGKKPPELPAKTAVGKVAATTTNSSSPSSSSSSSSSTASSSSSTASPKISGSASAAGSAPGSPSKPAAGGASSSISETVSASPFKVDLRSTGLKYTNKGELEAVHTETAAPATLSSSISGAESSNASPTKPAAGAVSTLKMVTPPQRRLSTAPGIGGNTGHNHSSGGSGSGAGNSSGGGANEISPFSQRIKAWGDHAQSVVQTRTISKYDKRESAAPGQIVDVPPIPLLLIVGTRSLNPMPADWAMLTKSASEQLHSFTLEPLKSEDVEMIVCEHLNVSPPLPESMMVVVMEKGKGNPFFSVQIAIALLDTGSIKVVDKKVKISPGVDLRAVNMPGTLQGVLLNRFDKLTATQQFILKVASVIGERFSLDLLRHIYPEDDKKTSIDAELKLLVKSEFLTADKTGINFDFQQPIMRDVCYSVLTDQQRKQLHAKIPEFLISHYKKDLSTHYVTIAKQYHSAGNLILALVYWKVASFDAYKIGAFEQAIPWIQELLQDHIKTTESETNKSMMVKARKTQALWSYRLAMCLLQARRIAQAAEMFEKALELHGVPIPKRIIGVTLGRELNNASGRAERRASHTAYGDNATPPPLRRRESGTGYHDSHSGGSAGDVPIVGGGISRLSRGNIDMGSLGNGSFRDGESAGGSGSGRMMKARSVSPTRQRRLTKTPVDEEDPSTIPRLRKMDEDESVTINALNLTSTTASPASANPAAKLRTAEERGRKPSISRASPAAASAAAAAASAATTATTTTTTTTTTTSAATTIAVAPTISALTSSTDGSSSLSSSATSAGTNTIDLAVDAQRVDTQAELSPQEIVDIYIRLSLIYLDSNRLVNAIHTILTGIKIVERMQADLLLVPPSAHRSAAERVYQETAAVAFSAASMISNANAAAQQSMTYALTAEDMAEKSGSNAIQARCSRMCASGLFGHAGWQAVMEEIDIAVYLAESSNDVSISEVLGLRMIVGVYTGDIDTVVAEANELYAIGTTRKHPGMIGKGLMGLLWASFHNCEEVFEGGYCKELLALRDLAVKMTTTKVDLATAFEIFASIAWVASQMNMEEMLVKCVERATAIFMDDLFLPWLELHLRLLVNAIFALPAEASAKFQWKPFLARLTAIVQKYPFVASTRYWFKGMMMLNEGKRADAIRQFQKGGKASSTHGMPFYEGIALYTEAVNTDLKEGGYSKLHLCLSLFAAMEIPLYTADLSDRLGIPLFL